MSQSYRLSVVATLVGCLLPAASSAAEAREPGATSVSAALRCECLREVREKFDPYAHDYSNPHMPTTGAELGLLHWVEAETIYRSCIARHDVKPPANPFPYGVDDYPGGPILDPPECRPG